MSADLFNMNLLHTSKQTQLVKLRNDLEVAMLDVAVIIALLFNNHLWYSAVIIMFD